MPTTMPGDKEHDQAIDESTSSTVVNNDESMAKNDANLNTFYEMHLTDTRESAAAAERTLSQPEDLCEESSGIDLEKIETLQSSKSFKEGGYGWLVCLSAFISNVVSFGVGTSWGVMQNYFLVDVFQGSVSQVQLTFVGTIAFIFINGMGPPMQILKSVFGARMVIGGGCLLMCLGLILAGFSTQVWHLYLTQGVMFGLGGSAMYITMMGTVPQWFDKRRGLALGLSASGSGIGGLVMPFIMNALLQKFGAPWTYRIIGFICLALGTVSTLLVREKFPDRGGRKKISDIVQWSVLKDNNLKLWCVAATITLFGYLVPFFYLPAYAYQNGLSTSQGSSLIAMISGLNFVGRIATGYIGDNIGRLNMLIIAMFISACCNLLIWPLSHTLGGLIAFSCIYGFFCGTYFTMMAAITAYIVKMDKFPSAFSVFLMCNIASSFGPPIAGAIQKGTGNTFLSVQIFGGCCFLVGSILMFALKVKMTKSVFAKV